MKKSMKKGFTIVELVIVIAVIGILAAVLIPTFSGVMNRANDSAAQQTARNSITSALLMTSNAALPENTLIVLDVNKDNTPDYAFTYDGSSLTAVSLYGNDNKIAAGLAEWTKDTNTYRLDNILCSEKLISKEKESEGEGEEYKVTANVMLENMIKLVSGTDNVNYRYDSDKTCYVAVAGDFTFNIYTSNEMPNTSAVFLNINGPVPPETDPEG